MYKPAHQLGRPKVLIVDDEPLVLSSYGRALRGLDVDVKLANRPELALEELERAEFDVVIADYRMPGLTGDAFLEIVRDRWPNVVRLLNTGFAEISVIEKAVHRGAIYRFLTKPCEPEQFRSAVIDALEQHQKLVNEMQVSRKLKLDLHIFRRVFHQAQDPMMIADLQGNIVEVNDAFTEKQQSARLQTITERSTILAGWDQEVVWPEIKEHILTEGWWEGDANHLTEERAALFSISRIDDQQGRPFVLAAIEKDITVRRQLEQQSWAAQYEVILALAKLAEYRDPETGAHLERMRRYSQVLAQQLAKSSSIADSASEGYAKAIYASSPLHDIGKVGIPDSVLLKPGKLDAEEWRIMKLHTSIGAEVLSAAGESLSQKNWLAMAKIIALQHHEKWDGSGYPSGLSGEQIDLSARIVALADAYDAITSKRVYKEATSHDEARSRILSSKGSHFDPRVVQAFLEAEERFLSIKRRYTDDSVDSEIVESEQERTRSSTWRRIETLIDSSSGRTGSDLYVKAENQAHPDNSSVRKPG